LDSARGLQRLSLPKKGAEVVGIDIDYENKRAMDVTRQKMGIVQEPRIEKPL